MGPRRMLTIEERSKVVSEYERLKNYSAVGKMFKISVEGVRKIIKKSREVSTLIDKPRSGRPRVTTASDDRRIVRQYIINPKIVIREIREQLYEAGTSVSETTIRRRLHDDSVMADDVIEFFPNVATNRTKVTWAHAVNSRKLLNKALSGNVMMLEADVVLGTLIDQSDMNPIPIMGHPPTNVSDISLEQFLNEIQDFNEKQIEQEKKKGIKLDFKTIIVFEESVPIVQSLYDKMLYPVWINADIIPGPIKSTTVPVDPVRFFAGSKNFKRSTLSIGWTTRYGIHTGKGSYTDEHIAEMLKTVDVNKVHSNITFPVRAGLAAESLVQMQHLIKNVTNSTLTIWSSMADPVNVEKLRNLILTIGLDTCYLDVPEDLANKLHLDRSQTE